MAYLCTWGLQINVKTKNEDEKEFKKQELKVGDKTGSCRLVLWQEDVESLEDGKYYRLVDVGMQVRCGRNYLSECKFLTGRGTFYDFRLFVLASLACQTADTKATKWRMSHKMFSCDQDSMDLECNQCTYRWVWVIKED